ncbi:helix-turn-helix domain-containing protein [Allostreptomyces psammosilenae]|uniref:Sugar-specific transcriptional regulator TrmB n=1 Tax=Allostreptomyces psammosilenae TaxID=1892865 RepID=A0A852ZSP8_9ACTN|nr:helix-turn-helix domain-containing protein [Allostreptomyces psammosilenae]NYI04527.1 sugar-specific transcriptional regulator TrmB [Allostreptomyces psammosilenae]
MLTLVGLDAETERVYRQLVRLGSGSVAELAGRAGVDPETARHCLRALRRRGLVSRESGADGRPPAEGADGAAAERYTAAPPAVALAGVLEQYRHDLRRAELAATDLAGQFRADAPPDLPHELVEVVVGAEAVRQRFAQIQSGAGEEVLAFVTARPTLVTGAENTAEDRAVRRGVRYRVVVERPAVEALRGRAGGEPAQDPAAEELRQLRVMETVPGKLVVADRRVALLPLTDATTDARAAALVVRAPALLESLVNAFEAIWSRAWPIPVTPDGRVTVGRLPARLPEDGPDTTDLLLLSLLMAGMTDAGTARQLGLSERTVQRRVRRLMGIAGVTSRLQLGWVARDRGWVPSWR